jgi:DNA-directed RNA polymerase II subunit RPB4
MRTDTQTLFCLFHYSILTNCLHSLPSALTAFRKETEDGEEQELHPAEVAALMNLVATDTMVEEAVALIPSLSRFPEAAIDEILDIIRSTIIRIVS